MILRTGRVLLGAIAAGIAALAILSVALAWRLSQGPVSLSFLTPYLAEALSYAEAGFSAEIEDTTLTWVGWRQALEVRAVNVRLRDAEGRTVARVPEISLGLSGPDLLRGAVEPTRIDIIGADVRLLRDVDGRLNVGGISFAGEAPVAGEDGATPLVLGLLMELSRPSAESRMLPHLNRVSILGAEITFVDRATETVWQAPRSDLVVQREPGGLRADLVVNLQIAETTTRLDVEGHYDAASRRSEVRIAFADLNLAPVARKGPAFVPLGALDFPVAGGIAFAIDGEGRNSDIAFDIAGGAGRFVLPQVFEAPLALRQTSAKGRLAARLGGVTLEAARLDFGQPVIELTGTMTFGGQPGIDISAAIRDLPTAKLGHYWPVSVARGARPWVLRNISGGGVGQARLRLKADIARLDSGDLPADAFTMDFDFDGLDVQYFAPMPKVTGARGSARLNLERLAMAISEAQTAGLALSEGKVQVSGYEKGGKERATVEFTATGPANEALALLDRKPLGFVSRVGLDPASVGGSATTRARFAFPLPKDLDMAQIDFAATADLRDVSVPKVVDRFAVSGADLALKVDRQGLDATGTAALNGVKVDLAWRQEFDPRATPAARYRLAGIVDDAGRVALGYPTEAYVTGPVGAEVSIETDGRQRARIDGRFDLKDAAMNVERLVWRKAAGVAGSLKMNALVDGAAPVRIEKAELIAGDLQAAGSLVVADGVVEQADVSRLSFAANSVSGRLRRQPDGVYYAWLEGPSFDLRPHLEDALSDEAVAPRDQPTVEATIRLDRAVIGEDTVLQPFAASLRSVRGRLQRLDANGSFAEGGKLEMRIAPVGPRRKVALRSDNAGQALRYLGFGDARGGTLALDAEIADELPQAPTKGKAVLENFRVVNQPVLLQLLTLGSFTGIRDALAGEGILFARAEVPFTLAGEMMTLERAHSIGPALGITAEGTFNRRKDEFNIGGTLVPAYTINSILGHIPLLGSILVGRPGEGVLGLSYRVTGTVEKPVVSVNPLSAFAPGILRRLFEIPESGEPVGDPAARPDDLAPRR